ncbi:MAG: ATPase, T2SS/T4P/T4SS family [Pseudomonadota bacterium]
MANPKAYTAPFLKLGERSVSVQDALRWMVELNATDLYLKVGEPVIFKVDGNVSRFRSDPVGDQHLKQLMACFFSQADLDRFRVRREVDLVHAEGDSRYRIHLGTGNHGIYAVVRRIAQDILPIEKLGLPAAVLPSLMRLRSGLVLVSGATGQGKTVTAVALLDHLARTRPATILTLEDPIEYIFHDHKGLFIQREVGMHVDSFADGVRAGLRENLDIIYVGEMRDPDTIEQVLKAAESGHLVLSTLHAEDTVGSLARIIGSVTSDNQSRIRYTLSAGLACCITQRLLPSAQGGRVLAAEVIFPTTAIRTVIRGGELTKLPIYLGKSGSGVTYREHLHELYAQRAITAQTRDDELANVQARQGG